MFSKGRWLVAAFVTAPLAVLGACGGSLDGGDAGGAACDASASEDGGSPGLDGGGGAEDGGSPLDDAATDDAATDGGAFPDPSCETNAGSTGACRFAFPGEIEGPDFYSANGCDGGALWRGEKTSPEYRDGGEDGCEQTTFGLTCCFSGPVDPCESTSFTQNACFHGGILPSYAGSAYLACADAEADPWIGDPSADGGRNYRDGGLDGCDGTTVEGFWCCPVTP